MYSSCAGSSGAGSGADGAAPAREPDRGDALAGLGEGRGVPGLILDASKAGLTVACGEGALSLTRLQLPGGKPLGFGDLYNSRREQFAPGLVLGQ